MRTTHTAAFPNVVRKMAQRISAFADVLGNLIMDVRDCYRPGLYEMRGPRRQLVRQVARSEILRSRILRPSRARFDA